MFENSEPNSGYQIGGDDFKEEKKTITRTMGTTPKSDLLHV